MQKKVFTDLPTLFFLRPLQETNDIFSWPKQWEVKIWQDE